MLTETEFDEIEQRCNAAPEGPWMVELNEDFSYFVQRHTETAPRISKKFYPSEVAQRLPEFDVTDKNGYVVHNPQMQCDLTDSTINQLNFIAYAREDIPKLIAEVKELKKNLSAK